jgi:hypothetical protein
MRPNPLDDVAHFLIRPGWFTPVFWLLLLASITIAATALRRDPAQRRLLGIAGVDGRDVVAADCGKSPRTSMG